jgi:hypothetical protein
MRQAFAHDHLRRLSRRSPRSQLSERKVRWMHATRASRRQPACDRGAAQDEAGHGGEGERVVRRHTKEQTLQGLRRGERGRDANQRAGESEPQSLPQYEQPPPDIATWLSRSRRSTCPSASSRGRCRRALPCARTTTRPSSRARQRRGRAAARPQTRQRGARRREPPPLPGGRSPAGAAAETEPTNAVSMTSRRSRSKPMSADCSACRLRTSRPALVTTTTASAICPTTRACRTFSAPPCDTAQADGPRPAPARASTRRRPRPAHGPAGPAAARRSVR